MYWDSERYWQKARALARRASADSAERADRPFWSALALELLARAALTKIHPVLNADPQSEVNILYAFGVEIKEPRSAPIRTVLARLPRFIPEFEGSKEFCEFFMVHRDRELHTSELAFEALNENKWLAPYYKACDVLCRSLSYTLADLFESEQAAAAQKLIAAFESDRKKEVLSRISAHRQVFEAKPQDQRAGLTQQQDFLALTWENEATATPCPACGLPAELTGELERQSGPRLVEQEVVVDETYLATGLECGACGLRLAGVAEIYHGGVEPHFTTTVQTDLHDYFEPEYYDEYNNM